MSKSIFIGLTSGYIKAYCLLIMGHALQHLNVEDAEIHWALTDVGLPESDKYHADVDSVMKITGRKYQLHDVKLTEKEAMTPYQAILRNRARIRELFLDSTCDELMMIGGDNPPWMNAVELLRECDADIAFGVSYQRPGKDRYGRAVYPMVQRPLWTMRDVEKHNLPRKVYQAFRRFFINEAIILPVYLEEDWEKQGILEDVIGGDGNCLLRRPVVEEFGWVLHPQSKLSEDMLYMRNALAYGYSVKCNTSYHVPHIHDENLRSY